MRMKLFFSLLVCALACTPACVSSPDGFDGDDEGVASTEDELAPIVPVALYLGGTSVAAGTAGAVTMAGILTIGGVRYWVQSNVRGSDFGGVFTARRAAVKDATRVKCPPAHFYADRGLDIINFCEDAPGLCVGSVLHQPCAGNHYNGSWIRYRPVGDKCKPMPKPAVECAGGPRLVSCEGPILRAEKHRCGAGGPQTQGIWCKAGGSAFEPCN
jgi:hypothetical protein